MTTVPAARSVLHTLPLPIHFYNCFLLILLSALPGISFVNVHVSCMIKYVCVCVYIYVFVCVCPTFIDTAWIMHILTYIYGHSSVKISRLAFNKPKVLPDLQICCPCALPFHKTRWMSDTYIIKWEWGCGEVGRARARAKARAGEQGQEREREREKRSSFQI